MPWAFGRMVLSSGALAAGTCALIYYLTQSEYGQASARSLPLSRPREKLQSFRQVRERGRELFLEARPPFPWAVASSSSRDRFPWTCKCRSRPSSVGGGGRAESQPVGSPVRAPESPADSRDSVKRGGREREYQMVHRWGNQLFLKCRRPLCC